MADTITISQDQEIVIVTQTQGPPGPTGADAPDELVLLSDVSIGSPLADNSILQYNIITGLWENALPGAVATIPWGNITGTLSDQLDLQAELDKAIAYTIALG